MTIVRPVCFAMSTLLLLFSAVIAESPVSTTRPPSYNDQRRQIQVDPVEVYTVTKIIQINTAFLTGDPNRYGGKIGVNTELLQDDGGRLKWIGVDSDYISVEPITTTDVAGKTTTTDRPIGVSVVGQVDPSGVPVTDFSVVMSPGFLAEVSKIGAASCGAGVKRNTVVCGIEFVPKVIAAYDAYQAVKGAAIVGGAVVGGVAIEAFIANLLKDHTEKGNPLPNKVDIPHADLMGATVTALPDSKITYTLARIPDKSVATTASSSSAETVCWLYQQTKPTAPVNNDDGDVESDDDDETSGNGQMRARNIAGRVAIPDTNANPTALFKRAAKALDHIGMCSAKITDTTMRPNVPNHFKANEMMANVPEDYWWYIPQAGKCGVATLTKVGKKVPANPATDQSNYPDGYTGVSHGKAPDRAGKYLNVDHVYETKLLRLFFEAVITNPDDPRCKPFLDLFNQDNKNPKPEARPSDPNQRPRTRLQSLWGQLPNKVNKAYVGMDYWLNQRKGQLLVPGLPQVPEAQMGAGTASDNINLFNDIAMASDILTLDGPIKAFALINTNIYRALKDFDTIQKCSNPGEITVWAEEYKNWIKKFLEARQDEITKRGSSLLAAILASGDLEKDGKPTAEKAAFDQLSQIWSGWGNGNRQSWPLDKLLDFSDESVKNLTPGSYNIERRDDCVAPPVSTKEGKYTERCKDVDIKDDHLLVGTCTSKDGKDVRAQADIGLCLRYDNGALIPADNGGATHQDCHGCFFNPPGSADHSTTLWCVCKNDKDNFAKSASIKLDDFMSVQDDGAVECFGHVSAPTTL